MEYLYTPGIVPGRLEARRYQLAAARACMRENTLLILPTGIGKTSVALIVAAEVLSSGRRVLMMAPTKPLVDQHAQFFSRFLDGFTIGLCNGDMPPAKRVQTVLSSDVVISTPQCIANDLEEGRYTADGFGLVVYDEAHKAVGNYAYVDVAKYVPNTVISVGMTASPGYDLQKIEGVCNALSLSGIFVRTEYDPDVAPYMHDTYVNRIEVNMPDELMNISAVYKKMLDGYFSELRRMRFLIDPDWPASTKHLLAVGQALQVRLARGERNANIYRGLKVQSICIKLLRAIDYVETQGRTVLRNFLQKIEADAEDGNSKADRELVARTEYRMAREMADQARAEHPKVSRVMGLISKVVSESERSKIIVFTQYRETCDVIVEKIQRIEGVRVCKLIGQSKGGQKQREQLDSLTDFREGRYNVIVSTSVGEEGLDITSTDAVIFYEPVPSEIRTIQRRGRTGRRNDGEVYVLVAKGTLDEVSENASKRKEIQMKDGLETLSARLRKRRPAPRGQTSLDDL